MTMMQCGRQVGKTTSMGAKVSTRAAFAPYTTPLCVAPLFEQIKRFSTMFVKPLIRGSKLKDILVPKFADRGWQDNVFMNTFPNGSKIIYSFCYLDVDRIRGVPGDYDDWAAQGATGWHWDNVLPYFRKAEGNSRGADALHGGDGPLSVSDLRYTNPLSQVFIDAATMGGARHVAAGRCLAVRRRSPAASRRASAIAWS